ncbi:MAG: PfkB family carbohydrate kinase, partial [Alphaproteobacteria bacterium]|nr:PfkB family carbohydrate kinase [Alphaproteobacteria bacterium]
MAELASVVSGKVQPGTQLAETAEQHVQTITRLAEGRRIAFVSGKFNIIHPGHLRLLKFAAESAEFLVVGVTADTEDGVTIPAEMRLDGIRAISLVSYACLIDGPIEEFIAELRPEIVVKGKEYEDRENSEVLALDLYGGRLLFSSGEVRFSSIQLIQREYYETDFSSIKKPRDFPARHGFNFKDLRKQIDKFADLKVVVVGDLIVDTYITCDPLGMSQEDPTIVVTPIEQKTFLGGAGIVAAHARGMGASVRFLTVVGNDSQAQFAREALDQYGVEAEFIIDPSRPTTHKQRYRALGKTLLRVNELRQHGIDAQLAARFNEMAREMIRDADVL